MLRRIAIAGAVVATAVALVAAPAEAGTGPGYYSPAEAGYAATVGNLTYVGAVLRIYNTRTGRLICSAALGNCADSFPSGWGHIAFRPGTSLDITLSYSSAAGTLFPDIATSTTDINYDTFALGSGASFGQVRIAAEVSSTPFAAAPFNAPAAAVRLGTFFEPPGPPYEAELAGDNGRSGCVGASWFTRHPLLLTKSGTATHVRARPGGIYGDDSGCDFSVFLEPL